MGMGGARGEGLFGVTQLSRSFVLVVYPAVGAHTLVCDTVEGDNCILFLCPFPLENLHLHLKAIRWAGKRTRERMAFNSF